MYGDIQEIPLVGGINSQFKPKYALFLSYKSHLLQVIENLINSGDLDEDQYNEVNSLRSSILSNHSSQVGKKTITKFLQHIVGAYMSSKSLIDINLNLENTKFSISIVGRPEVTGSSTKQMRHVSPFSFSTSIISTVIEQAGINAATLFEYLKVSLMSFIRYDHGVCIEEEYYTKLCDELGHKPDVYILQTTSKKYYLLDEKNSVLYLDRIDYNPSSQYKQKKEKFVKHALDLLQTKLSNNDDDNTFIIASEAIARLIMTLYNTKPYAAFPDEGNSISEEIRVYDSIGDAKNPQKAKKPPTVFTQKQFCEIPTEKLKEYDKRIRLVDNEGYVIRTVLEALKLLDDIARKKDLNLDYQEQLGQYNKKIKALSIFPLIDINNESLGQHVAENLYRAFDFKPLEQNVFVSNLPKNKEEELEHIFVYPSATGKKLSLYAIRNGVEYRKEQVNNAKGYNKDVTFRTDKDVNESTILVELIKSHIKLATLAFTGFFDTSIGWSLVHQFIGLLGNDYNFNNENKQKLIKDCFSIFSEEDMESASHESTVEEAKMSGEEGIIAMEMYLN